MGRFLVPDRILAFRRPPRMGVAITMGVWVIGLLLRLDDLDKDLAH
jgi:hypothetical protein